MSHQRHNSNSFRIAIDTSSARLAGTKSQASPSPTSSTSTFFPRRWNRRTSPPTSPSQNTVNWMQHRLGQFHLPKRWLIPISVASLVLGYFCIIHLFTPNLVKTKAQPPSRWTSFWRNSWEELVPVVDRMSLEKLRLLEIHYDADQVFGKIDSRAELGDDGFQESTSNGESMLVMQSNLDVLKDGFEMDQSLRQLNSSAIQDFVQFLSDDRPPRVEGIPEAFKIPNPLSALPKIPSHTLDPSFCSTLSPTGECLFILPAWLGEQETKSQLHLYQLGLLALGLNRTLVLPPVAKSRYMTCAARPFSFYYNTTSLSDLGIPTLAYETFLEWTETRYPSPNSQMIAMFSPNRGYPTGAIEIDSSSDPSIIPSKPNRNLCLRPPKTSLDFSAFSPLTIYPPAGFHKSEMSRTGFGESVVHTLASKLVAIKSSRKPVPNSVGLTTGNLPNVLVVNYELRFPILSTTTIPAYPNILSYPPLPFTHFAYADRWLQLGQTLAEKLSPFIAVHWRTETLAVKNLRPCAISMIDKIEKLITDNPKIKTVYLATDYPIEGLYSKGEKVIPHSGTFTKLLTPQHDAAFHKLLQQFNKRLGHKGIRLTSFSHEQSNLNLPPLEDLPTLVDVTPDFPPKKIVEPQEGEDYTLESIDAGLIGIMDKIVSMKSEIFLAGYSTGAPNEVCGKASSFTQQIIGERGRELERLVEGVLVDRRIERESRIGYGDFVQDQEEADDDEEPVVLDRAKGRVWNRVARWGVGIGDYEDEWL